MNEVDKRKWIEIGQMLTKLNDIESDNPHSAHPYLVADLMDYDELKYRYFKDYKQVETDEVVFEIAPEMLQKLYDIADDQDKLIDEVVIDILESHLNQNKRVTWEITWPNKSY